MVKRRSREHILYRFYDSQGTLLYVGITGSLEARTASHRAHRAWWRLVSTMTVERFETRAQSEVAERLAIRDEDPLFNVARYAPESLERHHRFRSVISTCWVCGEPVAERLYDEYDEEVLTRDHMKCSDAIVEAFRRGRQYEKERRHG